MTFLERRRPVLLTAETNWEYAHFIAFYSDAAHGRLLCGYEPGISCFSATCPSEHLHLLTPYLEILLDHQKNPLLVEAPVVPLTHDARGRRVFSPEGARYDYPHASAPVSG